MAESPLNVRKPPYNAAGNGTTDDTQAFQKALDDAKKTGETVYAPPGRYKIEGTLRVPANVTLEGSFRAPPMAKRFLKTTATSLKNTVKGTLLEAYSGRGQDIDATLRDGMPFITLEGPNSTLKGLAVFYPEQTIPQNGMSEIKPYPWTIRTASGNQNHNNAVIDVLLVNSFAGVDLSDGSPRHLIQRLHGQPLYRGIQVDRCHDIGRIEDVHFWPFWTPWSNPHVHDFVTTKGIALVLRETDWQIVNNFFCFGYSVGVSFEPSEKDPEKHGSRPNGHFSNLNLDAVDIGLDVHVLKNQGIHVSNLNVATHGEYANRCAIWGRPELSGLLEVRGGSFWGPYKEVVRWEADAPGMLMLSSSNFQEWEAGESAVRIKSGRAIVRGNYFPNRIGRAIKVEAGADVSESDNVLAGNSIEK